MISLGSERQTYATDILNFLREEKIGTPEDSNLEKRKRINQFIKILRPVTEKEAQAFPAPGFTGCVALTLLKFGACQELIHRFTLEYFLRFKRDDISLIFAGGQDIGSGDNHSFCLIGRVVVDDALIIGRVSNVIAKSEFFIPIDKFLAQQPDDTLIVDPLLDFSDVANRSNKTLSHYCKDHKITHVVAVRQYSIDYVNNASVIKMNAEFVANKIKPSLADQNVAKAAANPKNFIAELLKKYKLDPADVNSTKVKEQALRRASMVVGSKNDLAILLSLGANINAQDDNPLKLNTALHVALMNKNYENAKFLISQGAKKDIQNADGITANDLILKIPAGVING